MTNFREMREKQMKISSLGKMKSQGKIKKGKDKSLFIHGPEYFDCLIDKWSRKEVMGLLGASGVGKSEIVLDIFKGILKNNPTGCVVFVSLEMTTQRIAERWFKMVEDDDEISDRFYVISNYDENDRAKGLSMSGISIELDKIRSIAGDVLCFAIDHLHIINPMEGDDLNKTCQRVKDLAVSSNSFGILLSQVPKSVAGKGEIPLDADSSYGCSQFKWIASYVMQIHRPIYRLEEKAGMNVLSWGYAKIREQDKNDKVKVGQNKILTYDLNDRSLRKPTAKERAEFKLYYDEMLEIKAAEEKFKAYVYDLSTEVEGKDGKVVILTDMFSGNNELGEG